jgi:hypothetical protein
LTLGEVKSTATETMAHDGSVTPSTNLQISGAQIAGLPVALNPQGLALPGPTVPLPVNETLARMLAGSNLTVKLVHAQQYAGRVLSPAVEITMPFSMPFKVPQIGQYSGTMTITIGQATAAMTGATAEAGIGSAGSDVGSATPTTPATPATAGSVGSAAAGQQGATPAGTGAVPSAPVVAAPTARTNPVRPAGSVGLIGFFDVRSLYALLGACAVMAWGLVQLIRILGVRKPWTSGIG